MIADLDAFLVDAGIRLEPVDEDQGRVARKARIGHGRGMGHGRPLTFVDCFSYALAKTHGAPLLFVGDDFSQTDIEPAL